MAGKPGAAVVEVRGGVAWVALDRPEKRNALDGSVWSALGEIGRELCRDASVRVVVVYGKGKAFCAGLDLSALASPGSMLAPARHSASSGIPYDDGAEGKRKGDLLEDGPSVEGQVQQDSLGPIERSIRELQASFSWLAAAPFPTIAAVHGHALGAGWQLALACDFVIAARGSQFGMLETTFGLVPDMGGTARLVRYAGESVAKYLVLTGAKVKAEDLLPLGLVAEVVDETSLMERVAEVAEDLCRRSPTALRAAKNLIEEAFVRSLEQSLRAEAAAQQECMTSPDFAEAVTAFLQKRPPVFSADPRRSG